LPRPTIDIVVPARHEATTLPRCLAALAPQLSACDARLIVVCNGTDAELSAAAVRGFPGMAQDGARLIVETCETPGKANALNIGDRHTRGGAVMYLDADIILSSNAVAATLERLTATDAPRLSAPRPDVVVAKSWLTRQYSTVWASLPGVADDVIGAGCYAVNAAGRGRWATFPDHLPDDSYVRSRFAAHERVVATDATFQITMPEGLDILPIVRRWAAGNAVLAATRGDADGVVARVGASPAQNLRHIAGRPDLWPSVPGFAAVWGLARVTRAGFDPAWTPVRPDAG